MTREEYEKLVKGALSFKTMPVDVQARILAAEGTEMQRYVEIFQEEAALVNKAYNSFQQETTQIVSDCKFKVKKKKADKLKAQETVVMKRDIDAAENLLKKI